LISQKELERIQDQLILDRQSFEEQAAQQEQEIDDLTVRLDDVREERKEEKGWNGIIIFLRTSSYPSQRIFRSFR
jgi:hypothetical protein